ncbi:MAG: MlaD family protein [Bacteroidales bacterium]|nr:MlaD family protein [Bacteroidales bacterium]
MVKISREFKVGLLFIVTLALFIWGFNFLKGKDFFHQQREFYAVYDKVDGLVPANPVSINGLKVGIVRELYFDGSADANIIVKFIMDDPIQIPANSIAKIFSSDLLGSKGINLILGNSTEYIQNGDTLISDIEGSLKEEVNKQMLPLKLKAENLMLSIDSVVSVIQYVFNRDTRENLAKSFESIKLTLYNLEHTTSTIDTLIISQKNRLESIIGNVESITSNLKNNREQFNNIISNFSALSDTLAKSNISTTLANTNDALKGITSVLEKVNKGEGSLGMLIHNDSLYNNLESSANELNNLLEDMRVNPGRYVHFSVFGRNTDKKEDKKSKK